MIDPKMRAKLEEIVASLNTPEMREPSVEDINDWFAERTAKEAKWVRVGVIAAVVAAVASITCLVLTGLQMLERVGLS
jgi:hypothetical protein